MYPSRNSDRKGGILPNSLPGWQQELAQAVTDPVELLQLLQLDGHRVAPRLAAGNAFPLRVPRYFVNLMRPGDPDDPLLRQVLPQVEESVQTPGFVSDPVGDMAAIRGQGMLQKYQGRALLITTGACAVHCRYCFRRHFPYQDESAGRAQWQTVLAELATRPEISEVILSGGDPLSLSDKRLGRLIDGLSAIPHLRRLRLHSRTPVVLPSRITDGLVERLAASPLTTSLVLHCNHPNELTPVLSAALAPLREAGITLLNQSVLLAGVNDAAPTLQALSEDLFDSGVLPYYLHALDPVAGAAHFTVPHERGRQLLETLRARLPGYLLPRLVCEQPGASAKSPL